MIINASGRSALILATGLFVCFAEPSPATAASADETAATSKSERATSGKYLKHGARHWKRYAHRRYGRVASKSSDTSKSSETRKADTNVADAKGLNKGLNLSASAGLPAIAGPVADANAQMTSAIPPADSAAAMSAKASTMLWAAAEKPVDAAPAADTLSVASDQLNNVDRTLPQNSPAAETVGMASARAAPVVADGNDGSDPTSLIGKIFIGFGALLTMASAARMLMA